MRVVPADERIRDCVDIRTRVFVMEQGVPEELEADGLDEEGSSCRHFLMLDEEGAPFGTFRGFFETPDTVHLQRFCILKHMRGRGFGREAFCAAEEFFKALGAKKLTFGAQKTAIGFYEKLGCRVVSEEFLDAGIPHRTMEKTL